MSFEIRHVDLFSMPEEYYLVHCVSADFALGAGIAKTFNIKFDMRNKLKYYYSGQAQYNLVGQALQVGRVFNLVTKEKCYFKPTLSTLMTTLYDLRTKCVQAGITKLAMPWIGCGLDGLDRKDVTTIIHTVFDDINIEIVICEI